MRSLRLLNPLLSLLSYIKLSPENCPLRFPILFFFLSPTKRFFPIFCPKSGKKHDLLSSVCKKIILHSLCFAFVLTPSCIPCPSLGAVSWRKRRMQNSCIPNVLCYSSSSAKKELALASSFFFMITTYLLAFVRFVTCVSIAFLIVAAFLSANFDTLFLPLPIILEISVS